MKAFWIIFGCLFAAGCASSASPNLYPNDHLVHVGQQQSQSDINQCCALADKYVKDTAAEGIAKDVAVEGSAGAVAAAGASAAGSISAGTDTDTMMDNAGRGAASGAVGAAMAKISTNIFKANEPCPAYKECVERCLRERGYEVVDWKSSWNNPF